MWSPDLRPSPCQQRRTSFFLDFLGEVSEFSLGFLWVDFSLWDLSKQVTKAPSLRLSSHAAGRPSFPIAVTTQARVLGPDVRVLHRGPGSSASPLRTPPPLPPGQASGYGYERSPVPARFPGASDLTISGSCQGCACFCSGLLSFLNMHPYVPI